MVTYFVVERGDELSAQLAEQFHQLAERHHMQISEASPDVVISIGGDGTMLQAFHRFKAHIGTISFVGIHTGHLGFFADWKPAEIEQLAYLVATLTKNSGLRNVQYPLVEIQITTSEGTKTHLALNEFTVKGVEKSLVARVEVNDEAFEMFRGDGICISSPMGSTAYNKSLNGALLHPSLEAIQIAEIASINNRVYRTLGSSMVLPKHHHCDLYPNEGQNILLTIDHQFEHHQNIRSIRCMVAEQKISFARYRPFPFWNRVREAFIGNSLEQ